MQLTAVAALVLCALLSACAAAPPRSPPADVAAIRQVVDAFSDAIVRKDRAAYLALFFAQQPQQIGWQAVVDDARLAVVQRERPSAIKARPIPGNNFVALIDSVVASPTAEEERISDVTIDTDGETASASFNYVYLSAGQPTNRGREHWQLVRTEQGWKIFSVVYTIRDPVPNAR